MTPPLDPGAALRAQLEGWLRCPTEPALTELEKALRAYQTQWITTRAGADAPPAPGKAGLPRVRTKLGDADRAVLERLAEGWSPTLSEVPRWAWFEDRELVRIAPDDSGTDRLRLTEEGWQAIGRVPPGP